MKPAAVSALLFCAFAWTPPYLTAQNLRSYRSPDQSLAQIYQEASRQTQEKSVHGKAPRILSGSVYKGDILEFTADSKYLPLKELEEIIQRVLPEAFYAVYPRVGSSEYGIDVYTGIKKQDMWVYAAPWKNIVFLLQGEWGITSARDANPMLATYSMRQTCRVLILYEPELKMVGLAHIDVLGEDERAYFAMVDRMRKLGARKFSLGYSPNMGNMELATIRKDLGEGLVREFKALGGDVLFDARTGQWTTISLGTLLVFAANNVNLAEREKRLSIRLDNSISYLFLAYPPNF